MSVVLAGFPPVIAGVHIRLATVNLRHHRCRRPEHHTTLSKRLWLHMGLPRWLSAKLPTAAFPTTPFPSVKPPVQSAAAFTSARCIAGRGSHCAGAPARHCPFTQSAGVTLCRCANSESSLPQSTPVVVLQSRERQRPDNSCVVAMTAAAVRTMYWIKRASSALHGHIWNQVQIALAPPDT